MENGSVVLPSGRRYALLALSAQPAMTLRAARAVKRLVHAGAAVAGNRPERSMQIADRERADAEVAEIGLELWGDHPLADGAVRQVGLGRIMGQRSLNSALNQVRPSGRRTLTSWLHFDSDSPLAPSGLLAPLGLLSSP